MNDFDAIIYGIIQGLTEFLPVSSSGHLALLPKFLKIVDPGVTFDLAMHVGTALAIMVYLRKDIIDMFRKDDKSFLYNQIIATIVSVVFIFIFKTFSEKFGRGHIIISINLIVFGILMIFADMLATKNETQIMENRKELKKSSLIGFFQALAIFPGVSRSGATLTISRFMGLSRYEAGRFSFLLSLPIIFAGFCYKWTQLTGSEAFDTRSLIIGVVASFVMGIITIHYFLKFIQKVGLLIFGVYRILLGGAVFLFY